MRTQVQNVGFAGLARGTVLKLKGGVGITAVKAFDKVQGSREERESHGYQQQNTIEVELTFHLFS